MNSDERRIATAWPEDREIETSHLWRYVVVTPAGEELKWTRGETRSAARSAFTPGLPGLWEYALEQGYSMREYPVSKPRPEPAGLEVAA